MIPVAIVAHITREKRAQKLADAVSAEFVTTDDGGMGPGRNHDIAWQWLAHSGHEWSVVLEDDAIPVKPFQEELAKVLRVAPSPIVSLYLGRGRPPHWQPSIARVAARDENFFMANTLLHHVAVAIKTPLVSKILAERDSMLPIDESIGRWAFGHRIDVAYSNPSIVDHEHKLETTITTRRSGYAGETNRRTELRKAWRLGKRDVWVKTVARIPPPNV